MNEHRKWAKAGRRRDNVDAYRAAVRVQTLEADQRLAYQRWRDGQLVPWRITLALDVNELYGPEVDKACGVAEPYVDMWEDGHLYPTWEQLCALAELTGFHPLFFTIKDEPLPFESTSLVYHVKPKDWPDPPVLEFLPEAYDAMRRTLS